MYKVIITDAVDERGIELLEDTGQIEVIYKPGVPVEDYIDDIGGVHGWIIRSGTKIGSDLLMKADSLKVIGRAGVGVDNIDIEQATLRGVVVMNTPTGNTNAATEQTMALMLAAARNTAQANASLKEGRWDRNKYVGYELRGKTLGIIGLGRIGEGVAKRSQSFEVNCIGYDPYLSEEQFSNMNVKQAELEEIFTQSDFITVHVPKSDQTKDLIGSNEISKMKDGVILINASRGGIYNESAVVDGLKSGKIAAIGFDVFDSEPLPEDHPFLDFDNAVLTPHLGASTYEAKENVAVQIATQLKDFLLNEQVTNAVNIPFADYSKLKQMESYLDLGERLGLLQVSLSKGAIRSVSVKVSGDVSEVKPITLAVLQGILKPISGEKVNMMNAALLAKQRQIKLEESYEYDESGYTNRVEVIAESDEGKRRVAGSLFGKGYPRIIRIEEFHMDARPVGPVLMIRNNDVPGVIGNVGSFLASRKINIAEYRLGRQDVGNTALAMVNLDEPINEEDVAALEKEPNILRVQQVNFPKEQSKS
jgi:D-3-phosphoglycerate dehydrogenase